MIIWWTFLANVGVGVVVAAASAWITVRLSLRRFRSERWWERRAAAYAEAVEALHRLEREMDDDLQLLYAGAHLPVDGRVDFLDERYPEAINAVHRAVDTSPFLMAKQGARVITEILEKLGRAGKGGTSEGGLPYPGGRLSAAVKVANEGIKELAAVAKADLSVE